MAKNKKLASLLAVTMLLAVMLAAFAACDSNPTEGLIYSPHDLGTVSKMWVTGYEGTSSKIVIPEKYEGKPVSLVSLTLSSAVKELHLPSTVNFVNIYFESENNLKKITVDKNNETYTVKGNCLIIKENKILALGCKNSKIPKDVTAIKSYSFKNCAGLKSITIPDSVTSIGDYAFAYCTGLTSVTIPDSVTRIDSGAFAFCTGLTTVNWNVSADDVILGGMGESIFWGCTNLNTVNIGNNVTTIVAELFSGCTGLTSITIPNSVTSIGYRAFSGCTGLTRIDYDGTTDEWNAIRNWGDYTGEYVVYCTDGTVAKDGTVTKK